MSTLNIEPADVAAFANGHRQIAGQIDSALDSDAPAVAAMPAAYGNVGAGFTAAVISFEAALTRTGAALTGDYRRMSEALDVARAAYVKTDEAGAAAIVDSSSTA